MCVVYLENAKGDQPWPQWFVNLENSIIKPFTGWDDLSRKTQHLITQHGGHLYRDTDKVLKCRFDSEADYLMCVLKWS